MPVASFTNLASGATTFLKLASSRTSNSAQSGEQSEANKARIVAGNSREFITGMLLNSAKLLAGSAATVTEIPRAP
jgi:hypothetical protein